MAKNSLNSARNLEEMELDEDDEHPKPRNRFSQEEAHAIQEREKQRRKNAMNETIGEALEINKKAKGFFDWLYAIAVIDDSHLQKLCGTDTALYLIYLRYCSNLFGILMALNLVILPLYMTGEPLPNDDWRREHKKTQYCL